MMPTWKRVQRGCPIESGMTSNGFTLIEVVIASFILGTIVVGIFSLMTLTLKASHDGQRRIVATGLANEKMEMIRNLPYASVGTVGGIPAGSIAQTEQVDRNSQTYTVTTDIRYIDDPYDGTATSSPLDTVNTDYKQARVEVTWDSTITNRSVLLIAQIAPNGIEGGDSLGTLVFQALNAAGSGVSRAVVRLVNDSVSPAINLTTYASIDGQVVIPGLPISAGTYQLTVSGEGYTTEQTYPSSADFTPDVDHSQLTTIAGAVTNKTFAIDRTSKLTINTVDQDSAPIGDVAYSIIGTKKIGTDALAAPVYLFSHQDSTDAAGTASYQDMTWDSYSFSIDGAITGYDIQDTSLPVPMTINPGSDVTLTVTLVPHTPISLHATVLDSAGLPVPDASVQVVGSAYDQTLQTGATGQVFFSDLPSNEDYAVTVTASGYQLFTGTATVIDTTQYVVNLAGA
ncbi:MAG: hypothetical protein A3E36_03715 [Candidatus Andersenbacteria bacterium RIFCSPHIGHO2_12_FULL_45_11b]|uniref:Prepilin-type N-terminal cleavage/methylation domain-containing protein n=1 Tax=Candidatus Andersenbacteria bacterium RIFCSPHIGHO2_12_FULL_45_11b TaxID=1797282 RepID=A0A1G1XA77_9BACT|nr:MAG: hypothetical protein A3E36_03715 [Candidatus Andersenbacteria bacterium RIFCSPHIGHO2_12_FULL_45_11b]